MRALAALLAATIVAPARGDAGVSPGLSSWYAWWDVSPDNDYSVDPKQLFGNVCGASAEHQKKRCRTQGHQRNTGFIRMIHAGFVSGHSVG